MNRRSFVRGVSAGVALCFGFGRFGPGNAQTAESATPFDHDWLVERARQLAAEAYRAPSTELPIPSSASLFEYGSIVAPPSKGEGMDFSGFRARTPINTPDAWQEFVVFQGASYFRAVARDQLYGLSARGLALDTSEPEGEEFPAFRQFWIEKPAPDSSTLVVHALLDSPSTTGAYRFDITPGADTVIEVEASIFTRQEVKKVGIAPLTSMFMFSAMNRAGFEDFRRAVHDSDGLLMLSGAGEWLYWRPDGPVPAGGPWRFSYRMRWTQGVRPPADRLSVAASRAG